MNSRNLSTGAELDSLCWIIFWRGVSKNVEEADPSTDLRCFEITIACLSWPKEARDCHYVPAQGVRAADSSVALSLTHHIYFTILAEKLCFMIFLICLCNPTTLMEAAGLVKKNFSCSWSGTTTPSTCFWEDEVSINDKEWLVHSICRKASFTLYLTAAHPCTVQQGKCCVLLYFYICICVYLTHHCSYPRASLLLSRSIRSFTSEQVNLCTGNCTQAQRS